MQVARAKDQKNGRLEEALTALVQNQATLVQTQAAFAARLAEADARMAETHARMVETDRINAERFAPTALAWKKVWCV